MGSKCSPNKQVLSAKTGSPAVEPQTSGKRQAQRCGESSRAAPRGLQDYRQKHAGDLGGQCSAADSIRRKPSSASPGSPHVSRPRRLIPKAPITRVSTNEVWKKKKKKLTFPAVSLLLQACRHHRYIRGSKPAATDRYVYRQRHDELEQTDTPGPLIALIGGDPSRTKYSLFSAPSSLSFQTSKARERKKKKTRRRVHHVERECSAR